MELKRSCLLWKQDLESSFDQEVSDATLNNTRLRWSSRFMKLWRLSFFILHFIRPASLQFRMWEVRTAESFGASSASTAESNLWQREVIRSDALTPPLPTHPHSLLPTKHLPPSLHRIARYVTPNSTDIHFSKRYILPHPPAPFK